MTKTVSEKVAELLDHLTFENPEPAEKWCSLDCWEPPFGKSEISYAVKHGWIEFDETKGIRFTAKGRRRMDGEK